MSEHIDREKSPELEPLEETCQKCEFTYDHTNDNSRLVTFEKQPDCNYILCMCPNCDEAALYFMDNEWQAHAEGLGITVHSNDDYAPDGVYQMMLRARDIELVKEVEISPRHEQIVRQFGETLCAMTERDPDGFWAEMESPNDYRPYPIRWI